MTNGRFTEQIMTAAMHHLADAYDLDASDARLLRLTNNAVFALPHANVVIRIARTYQPGARVAKGVALAAWFADIDAPTIRLTGPAAQPLLVDGLQATVWRYLPPRGLLTARDLGAALKQLHALGLPPFELPQWDPVADARRRLADAEALSDDDRQTLTAWCDDLEPRVAELRHRTPATLVHGDAHVGNLLHDGDRVVFCDFDATSAGPWQADLVAVPVGEERFGRPGAHRELADTYGYDVRGDPDWPLLRAARELKMVIAAVPLLASTLGVADEFRLRLSTILNGDTTTAWTPFADLR